MSKKFNYISFEEAWLHFNKRVFSEALRSDLPLLERLKYLAIVGSNLDEFFMVRYARLTRQVLEDVNTPGPGGRKPKKTLLRLQSQLREQIEQTYDVLEGDVLPALGKEGITIKTGKEISIDDKDFMGRLFEDNFFPVVTPRMVSTKELSSQEILSSGGIYVLFYFSDEEVGLVKIPENLNRFVTLSSKKKQYTVIPLEDLIILHGSTLFPGKEPKGTVVMKITRDADLSVEEETDEDFLSRMEETLDDRLLGRVVRLELCLYEGDSSVNLTSLIPEWIGLEKEGVYYLKRLPGLSSLMELVSLSGFKKLQFPPWEVVTPAIFQGDADIFTLLKEQDVLLHHPYESFEPVERFLTQAAEDEKVLAIKMTLYRTSGNSPLVRALESAARQGKQVTVLIEVKARFDEGRNISWAKRLERAGAIVIYGMKNLKVHAKAAMVIRREDQGIRQYVHLGTGNYNDKTAKLYTDLGLMTSRPEIALDTALFFNAITGHSTTLSLKKLTMAPLALRGRFNQLIRREIDWAKQGRDARIVCKMNGLNDPDIIKLLYKASQAGVKIELNVRAACSLVPGLPDVSENIRVVSIIDRYLEHTRLYSFLNGGKREIYFASADWRTRNLDRRIELLVPLEGKDVKRRAFRILETYFIDNQQSHEMDSEGEWHKIKPEKKQPPVRSQQRFQERTIRRRNEAQEFARRELQVRRKPPE